jgi:hypothetical protein
MVNEPGSPNDGGPADPMTALSEGAVQVHELFMEYRHAGFTEGQAFAIINTILAAVIRNQNGGVDNG